MIRTRSFYSILGYHNVIVRACAQEGKKPDQSSVGYMKPCSRDWESSFFFQHVIMFRTGLIMKDFFFFAGFIVGLGIRKDQ